MKILWWSMWSHYRWSHFCFWRLVIFIRGSVFEPWGTPVYSSEGPSSNLEVPLFIHQRVRLRTMVYTLLNHLCDLYIFRCKNRPLLFRFLGGVLHVALTCAESRYFYFIFLLIISLKYPMHVPIMYQSFVVKSVRLYFVCWIVCAFAGQLVAISAQSAVWGSISCRLFDHDTLTLTLGRERNCYDVVMENV